MGQTSISRNSPVLVETNNFLQVLVHFNEEGHITHPDTVRFAVSCQICCKDLALINDGFDRYSRATHEAYAVLPRCGHAFGYKCLHHWLSQDSNIANPQCPSCRADVYCENGHPVIFEVYGAAGSNAQHEDIVEIRQALRTVECEACGTDATARKPKRNVYIHHEIDYARLLISQDVLVDRDLLDEQMELYQARVQQLSSIKDLLVELEQLDREEFELGQEGEVNRDLARRWKDLQGRRLGFVEKLGECLEQRSDNYRRLNVNSFSQIENLLQVVNSRGREGILEGPEDSQP